MTGRDDILAQTSCGRCEHNALVHEAVGKHACTIDVCPCAYFVMPTVEKPEYTFNQYITNPVDQPVEQTAAEIYRETANKLAGAVQGDVVADFMDKFGKGETRTISATGGMKGVKPQRYDLIPVEALEIMARLYGFGAEKYDAHNWRKGYDWSKSYASLMRHATQFWAGEDIDEETGLPHLAGVAFHAFTLMVFMQEQPQFDDRFKVPESTAENFDESRYVLSNEDIDQAATFLADAPAGQMVSFRSDLSENDLLEIFKRAAKIRSDEEG